MAAGRPVRATQAVYCFSSPWLWTALDELTPAANGELYLTGLAALAAAQDNAVSTMPLDDSLEALGVNDGVQLARARDAMQRRINERWLLQGVTVMEPAYIDVSVYIEPDTVIYPNTFLKGETHIGGGCQIGPGSMIEDSVIADGCRVWYSVVESAVLEEGVDIGPYSHIRPETHIDRDVHIGNFVEVKKSSLGRRHKDRPLHLRGRFLGRAGCQLGGRHSDLQLPTGWTSTGP